MFTSTIMGVYMKQQVMKKIARSMGIALAVTLSFFLSLTGNLIAMVQSGQFSAIMFLLSFILSTIISLIIGLVVPMQKIHLSLEDRFGPGLMGRYLESLISDLIYTPLMTFLMVLMAYIFARNQGQNPPFLGMFLPSLGICFVVGYILILILQPLYLKLLLKKYGVTLPGGRQD